MEEVTKFRVKIVYYYLGWVLEALRLSLNNQNRSRVANNQMPFNPKFKYMKNENVLSFCKYFIFIIILYPK